MSRKESMTEDKLNRDSTAPTEDIAWIETVHPAQATGYAKSLYEGFQKQRGWIPNILKSTTIRPDVRPIDGFPYIALTGLPRLPHFQSWGSRPRLLCITPSGFWTPYHRDLPRPPTSFPVQ